ncbi:MAG: FtsQ-type POTRA domain-containing protein [Patescibacteria group bacterium]|nr:FtsQ-type POTRA domain-containing protein [Patescibacteria group bacterium]
MRKWQAFRKPYRVKRKKSIFKNRFFWLGILILIGIGTIFYFLFFSEIFQVKKIIVTGEDRVFKEPVQSIVQKELEREILFFKTKSIFLVDLERIRKNLLNQIPQIEVIGIQRLYPDGLGIWVIKRKGIGIFCRNDSCFLLDPNGVIFEKAPEKSDFLRIKYGKFKEELKLGERVIEKEKLSQILEIESKLKDLNISLVEISIISEERLNALTSEGWEIYLNPIKDLEWQLVKLGLVLKERIPPDKRKSLKYIDLRFEKIYIFPETYRE